MGVQEEVEEKVMVIRSQAYHLISCLLTRSQHNRKHLPLPDCRHAQKRKRRRRRANKYLQFFDKIFAFLITGARAAEATE